MIIFAVDSSAAAGSAALIEDGKIIYEAYANEGLTHSETLLVRCDEVFRATGKKPADVDAYAITSGPGSFTGLRIGMGLVKGFAFPGNKPCIAVPTFDALAQSAADSDRDVLTVLDARQKRVYYALFRKKDGCMTRICEDGISAVADLPRVCEEMGVTAPLVVGDVAESVCTVLKGAQMCSEEQRFVHAGHAGVAAYRLRETDALCEAAMLKPFYLQLSQAERTRNEKENIK